jgi:hypothetical protein
MGRGVTSANITPNPSGIGYYDEATFIRAMRTGYVGARELSSIMPFGEFQNLNDDDLMTIARSAGRNRCGGSEST